LIDRRRRRPATVGLWPIVSLRTSPRSLVDEAEQTLREHH
jgi:hypothetical protein